MHVFVAGPGLALQPQRHSRQPDVILGPKGGRVRRFKPPECVSVRRQIRDDFMKRQRGRGRRSGGGGNNPNRHFESNGPDVKIRGSAQQILDKYLQYARDAQTSGDRVMSEAYFQHAEHYQRLLASMQPKEKPKREREDGDTEETSAETDSETSNEAKTDAEKPESSDDTGEDKPRRSRSRTPREKPESDPLEVVDADASEAPQPETAEAEEEAPKPKRRRTYKKREPEADSAADEAGGVMATLSRGRSKPEASESEPSEDVDTPAK